MYSQEFYFEPRAGGDVKIFGFYNNQKTSKQTKELDWYKTFPPDHFGQVELNDSTMFRNTTSIT